MQQSASIQSGTSPDKFALRLELASPDLESCVSQACAPLRQPGGVEQVRTSDHCSSNRRFKWGILQIIIEYKNWPDLVLRGVVGHSISPYNYYQIARVFNWYLQNLCDTLFGGRHLPSLHEIIGQYRRKFTVESRALVRESSRTELGCK